MKPYGPGAFPLGISWTTWSISSFAMGLHRMTFWSSVTNLGMCWVILWMASDLSRLGSLAIPWNWLTSVFSMSWWDSLSILSWSLILNILLWDLLAIVVLWKNLVFLSPSLSQLILYFWSQRISSCLHLASHSWRIWFSYFFLSSVYPSWMKSSCSFLILSSMLFFP